MSPRLLLGTNQPSHSELLKASEAEARKFKFIFSPDVVSVIVAAWCAYTARLLQVRICFRTHNGTNGSVDKASQKINTGDWS